MSKASLKGLLKTALEAARATQPPDEGVVVSKSGSEITAAPGGDPIPFHMDDREFEVISEAVSSAVYDYLTTVVQVAVKVGITGVQAGSAGASGSGTGTLIA